MLKTTSIYNYYSLTFTNIATPLTIRVPKNLKVFRAHFMCDNREDTTMGTSAYISTDFPGVETGSASLTGIFLTSTVYTEMTVPVAPDIATGNNQININSVILDRRGIGYMTDEFYVFGKGGISVIWEGIIED
jgi:hypothetical protein